MPSNLTIFNWPQQTIFGPRASGEVGRYANGNNLRRAVVITDQGVHAENLSAQLTRSLAEARVQFQINTQARRDVADTVVEDINRKLKNTKLDLIVAIGGGSVIDTAKAVGILYTNGGNIREYEGIDKVQRPIPHLYAVPTTSGPGSEASKFCLVLDTGKKKKLEIVSSRIIPEMIFIDPLLATSMPPELTASCGMDALSNSVEAYFSTRANPLTDAKSIHALRLISESLRTAVANGKNLQAREKMALASFEAGLAFTNTHSGAVHALGHPLAGMFGIPEGVSNAILLPHVMRYSLNASLDRMVDVAEAMGETVWGLSKRDAAEKAIGAIKRLIVDIGLPTTLGKVGIKKDAIVAMSRQAQEDSLLETSPFVLKTRDIEQIYEDAFVEYPPPVFQAPPPVSPSTH